ncbi:MAG: ROK family protein [Arcanobacterium sp.]|nr:ROK family protein [Arcanobacterium sp.]
MKRIGVDIGGTTMSVAEVTDSGEILNRVDVPSPAAVSGEEVVRVLRELIADKWANANFVGIGTAGVIDPATGSILAASDSFKGWQGFPLKERVQEALGIPVAVDNDVNSFLLGEQQCGIAVGEKDCLGIMLGTGVGGAFMLDGKLWSGARGAAAEIGHMPGYGNIPCTCGGTGHLETLASGRSIGRRYRELSGDDSFTEGARVVEVLAKDGNEKAIEVYLNAGRGLALAMLQASTLLDITTVVLGGGVIKAWDLLKPGVDEFLSEHPLVSGAELSVRRSTLGADAVLIGASRLGVSC